MKKFVLAAAASCLIPTPALAWYEIPGEDRCAFAASFEGPGSPQLIVVQSKEEFEDDFVSIIVANDNWSIENGEEIGIIRLEDEDGEWLENEAVTVNNGFGILTTYEYAKMLFGEVQSNLLVKRNDEEIDNFNMSGSFSAWYKFDQCRRPWVEAKEAAEHEEMLQRRFGNDPFAD